MLPRRKPKKEKRSERWKKPKHLAWIRGFECAIGNTSCDGATEAAHVRIDSGAGMGQKPSDYRAVPLCRHHHQTQHTAGERTFWDGYAETRRQTVEQLIDELCKASPCAAEIRKAREQ